MPIWAIKRIYSLLIQIVHKDLAPRDVWNLYFAGECTNYVNNKNNPKFALSAEYELFLFQCMFQDIENTVIDFILDGAKIMHSECSFDRCSGRDAGVLQFVNYYCSIVQHRFCSINCSIIAMGGLHSFIWMRGPLLDSLNYVDESSACVFGGVAILLFSIIVMER